MRTLILSDLHLGNGGEYDIFAGSVNLPALLDRFNDKPTRVILNGDSMDFLMNEEPLQLDAGRAVRQAESIVSAPPTEPTIKALGRICASGGEVIIRMGNHDIELWLGEVQEVFRNSLGQPETISRRVKFEHGDQPHIMNAGGVKILVTHGEQNDPFNMVDYDHLPGSGSSVSDHDQAFHYAPGSILVKEILNPLKKKYHMRFMDLLKPDFQGAVLTALAVDPLAVKVALKGEALEIISGALDNLGNTSFAPGEDKLGLAGRVRSAGLTQDEIDALKLRFSAAPAGVSYGIISDALAGVSLKLARAGLRLYARAHRGIADDSGASYFSYAPDNAEMAEARRLSSKYGVKAVITGHSHAARWNEDSGLLYANTGTWIWLMRLPDEKAGDDEWVEFLQDLKDDPRLKSPGNQARLEKRFTPVLVEPRQAGGATIFLAEWDASGELKVVHSASLIP